ncbi:MAG: hypothetical protein N4A48_10500 [Tepidibacter sp.]|jgi:hypothetical protein|uniref:GapS4b family protein n=1 Tax=Tepidibacter sp. TaxID=2529387 RepID=UPI0025D795FE|nr:hypothetical protein [Tepidibacter sp.]MCT4509161.1 hypothetical protein [Tepidibacter sp.]
MTDISNMEINIDTLLPYGSDLKPLLSASFITEAELKKLLFNRGVYISNTQKNIIIPLLTTTLLSPREFDKLREMQSSKEEIIKKRTQQIKWISDSSLLDAINEMYIPINQLNLPEFRSYEPKYDLNFRADDADKLILEYEIVRNDFTKSLLNYRSTHEGRIIIKKVDNGNKIKFDLEHTTSETDELNKSIVKYIKGKLESRNHIDKKEKIENVISGDFSNKKRFEFLLSLTEDDNFNGFLNFKRVSNIEIGPNSNAKLPDEIDWMNNGGEITNIILKGKKVHESIYLKEEKYYEGMILQEVISTYKFEISGAKGTCVIVYGFPGYLKTVEPTIEFEAKVYSVHLEKEYQHVSKKNVSRKILDIFDKAKMKKYYEYKS